MPEEALLPVYHSTRLVGCELELDSVGTEFRAPTLPEGWTAHSDASVTNGREYVLEPPHQYNSVLPYIRSFSAAVERARTNMGKKGGFHVHVQAQEFNQARPAWLLARVYTHFQKVIGQMLAPSRSNNRYCQPFAPHSLNDPNYIYSKFNLGSPARSRDAAKSAADRFFTINYGMCRCVTPAHRSLEFRQGSPSGMVINIYGWMTFVLALTELVVQQPAMAEQVPRDYPLQRIDDLADLLARYEEVADAQHLAAWVKWRHAYMTARPTAEQVEQAVALLNRPHGIFFIGEKLGVHNKLAHDILEQAVREGKATKTDDTHYRSLFETSNIPTDDLPELERLFEGVSRPGEPSLHLSDLFPPRPAPRPPTPRTAEQVSDDDFARVTSPEFEEGDPVVNEDGDPVPAAEGHPAPAVRPEPIGQQILDTPNGPMEFPIFDGPTLPVETPVRRRRPRPRRQTPDVPQISDNRSTWVMGGQRYHILSPAVLASLPAGHTVFGLGGETYQMPLTALGTDGYGQEHFPVVGLPEDEFALITNEGEPVSYQTNVGEGEEV